jgi:hypothetical protein
MFQFLVLEIIKEVFLKLEIKKYLLGHEIWDLQLAITHTLFPKC